MALWLYLGKKMIVRKSAGNIILEMSPQEAAALTAAVGASNRRRWQKCNQDGIMDCWQCTAIEALFLAKMKEQDIAENCKSFIEDGGSFRSSK